MRTTLPPRFAAIGDVHAEDVVLAAALDQIAAEGIEVSVCVGDLVDGPGDLDRCCALLRSAGVLTVRGNHDRWALRQGRGPSAEHGAWLASLPTSRRFDTDAGGLLLCHGVGDDDMATLRADTDEHSLAWLTALHAIIADPSVAWMLAGHTHARMVRGFAGLTVINVGTLLRGHSPGFAIVEIDAKILRWFDYEPEGRFVEAAPTRLDG